jgi:hypothetical protein
MAQAYVVEGPSEAKEEILAMYEDLKVDFPDAELEVHRDTGNYCICIEGGEPLMTMH